MQNSPADVFAFCPRCGASGFKPCAGYYHQCGSCSFRLYTNAASAVMAVIETGGSILLTRRAHDPHKGKLDLPGGFVDVGETAEEALVREVREELNLEIVNSRFMMSAPNTYHFAGLTYFTLDLAFTCEVTSLDAIKTDDDVDGYVLVPLKKVLVDEIGLDSARLVVSQYLSIRDNA